MVIVLDFCVLFYFLFFCFGFRFFVGHHYVQTYTKINKTRALLQTNGDKDKPNIVLMLKSYQISQHGTEHVKTVNIKSYHILQPHKVQGKPLACPVDYKSLHIVQDSHMLYSVVCLDNHLAGRDGTDVPCLAVAH